MMVPRGSKAFNKVGRIVRHVGNELRRIWLFFFFFKLFNGCRLLFVIVSGRASGRWLDWFYHKCPTGT